MHFEALVAVGGTEGDGGFEAESVDVSREGMRLRTAYLPEVGERLMCRFDGLGLDVTVEAEVTWRRELARGGEFGVCFLSHDKATADALRTLCAPPPEAQSAEIARMSARGARVKLHIEGLASPMKARVRDSDATEVQVGSNLEFLKVGRPVDFEDVDQKTKREAYVDHVKVEIDPETSVPQLVVSLRFDGVLGSVGSRATTPSASPVKVSAAPAPKRVAPQREPMTVATDAAVAATESASEDPAMDATSRSERSPRPTLESPMPARADSPADSPAESARLDAGEDASADAGSLDEAEGSEREADGEEVDAQAGAEPSVAPAGVAMAALRSAGSRVAGASAMAASRVAPAMGLAGAKVKGALAGILERVRQKQGERAASKKRPRRTTSPPPSGALRSDGRRLVRDPDAVEGDLPPRRSSRKAALAGSALGLIAVLGVWGGAKALGLSGEDTSEAPRAVLTAAPEAPVAALPPAVAPAGGPVANAEIPLFGTTPLSTTEQVMPPPPAPGEAALAASPPTDSPAEEKATPVAELARTFGRGEVHNPKVLKIKMDGPIAGIEGSEGGNGFTVRLPDRKSLSSVSQLARKDKRIDSVKAVNRADGAEITVRFNGEVPPFMASAKGDRLEIEIGSEKKVASKASSKKKK